MTRVALFSIALLTIMVGLSVQKTQQPSKCLLALARAAQSTKPVIEKFFTDYTVPQSDFDRLDKLYDLPDDCRLENSIGMNAQSCISALYGRFKFAVKYIQANPTSTDYSMIWEFNEKYIENVCLPNRLASKRPECYNVIREQRNDFNKRFENKTHKTITKKDIAREYSRLFSKPFLVEFASACVPH